MINILIVEDKPEKQQEINAVLSEVCKGYQNINNVCLEQ